MPTTWSLHLPLSQTVPFLDPSHPLERDVLYERHPKGSFCLAYTMPQINFSTLINKSPSAPNASSIITKTIAFSKMIHSIHFCPSLSSCIAYIPYPIFFLPTLRCPPLPIFLQLPLSPPTYNTYSINLYFNWLLPLNTLPFIISPLLPISH